MGIPAKKPIVWCFCAAQVISKMIVDHFLPINSCIHLGGLLLVPFLPSIVDLRKSKGGFDFFQWSLMNHFFMPEIA